MHVDEVIRSYFLLIVIENSLEENGVSAKLKNEKAPNFPKEIVEQHLSHRLC